MLESPDKKASSGLPVGTVVFALAAIVGVAGAYFLYQDWVDRAPLLPQLTEEAKGYLPNLDLSDVEMTAEESFLEQTIVSIEGKITNNGTRALRAVDIHCVFREPYGQEVGRELVRIVGRRGNELPPGGTRSFRLAFDDVALEWNQALPDLYIAQVVFAE